MRDSVKALVETLCNVLSHPDGPSVVAFCDDGEEAEIIVHNFENKERLTIEFDEDGKVSAAISIGADGNLEHEDCSTPDKVRSLLVKATRLARIGKRTTATPFVFEDDE